MSETTETLAELGQRARAVVEELARSARSTRGANASRGRASDTVRAEDAPDTARAHHEGAGDQRHAIDAIFTHLSELRACVDGLTDVLEAAVERLETVEGQLGDPDAGVERQLADGIRRCERVLMGIEHRVQRSMRRPRAKVTQPARPSAAAPAVLVVARDSGLRAQLCLALERQGFRSLAAADFPAATRLAAAHSAAYALVAPGGSRDSRLAFFEDWKESEERGSLPRAAVLDRGEDADAATAGFAVIREDHGEAAMAASLMDLLHEGNKR